MGLWNISNWKEFHTIAIAYALLSLKRRDARVVGEGIKDTKMNSVTVPILIIVSAFKKIHPDKNKKSKIRIKTAYNIYA